MGRKTISIFDVCERMIDSRHWRTLLIECGPDDHPQDKVTYRQFEDFLIGREITTSPRRCRELRKYLRMHDLGRQPNQAESRVR